MRHASVGRFAPTSALVAGMVGVLGYAPTSPVPAPLTLVDKTRS